MLGQNHPQKDPLNAKGVLLVSLKGMGMNTCDDAFVLVRVVWCHFPQFLLFNQLSHKCHLCIGC